jgi:type II secretory pathway component PulK
VLSPVPYHTPPPDQETHQLAYPFPDPTIDTTLSNMISKTSLEPASIRPPSTSHKSEQGVALLLVIFMIVLASALLASLAESTYVTMRLNSAAERRVRAEYVLKSAVNFAQVLIKNDVTPYDDPVQDAWMAFSNEQEIPGQLLGLNEPNVRITLLISSEAGQLPMGKLLSATGTPNQQYIEIFARLFKTLGLDQPSKNTIGNSSSGAQPQRVFTAEELVANIVDYLDTDTQNFQMPSLPAAFKGMEESLPPDAALRNQGSFDSLVSELGAVPGFTPDKVQKLLPFVANTNLSSVNVNAAPVEVIMALSPLMTQQIAEQIVAFRNPQNGGPFTTDMRNQLTALAGPNVINPIASILSPQGSYFEVIAKVDYGTSTFMASAELQKGQGGGRLPTRRSFQMY